MDPSNIPPGLVHVQRQERDGLLTVSLLRNVISFVHDFDSVVNALLTISHSKQKT